MVSNVSISKSELEADVAVCGLLLDLQCSAAGEREDVRECLGGDEASVVARDELLKGDAAFG